MAPESFKVESLAGKSTGQLILRVSGHLDINTEQRFLELVRAETAPILILDLSGVQNCDSRGIAALVQIYQAFQREGRRLALAGLNERVRLVLSITRVGPLFKTFTSPTEAEETFI